MSRTLGAMDRPRANLGDAGCALLLGAATTALCLATRLQRIFGNDGAMLVDWTADPARAYEQYHNTLYLPAARAVAALGLDALGGETGDPTRLAHALSALAAGATTALAFAIARGLGASRAAAAFGAGLLALSPALWFFGAAVEVHTLHAAVVAAVAWATLRLPWRRPATATALLAALFVLPCLSHQASPALAPGFVGLAAVAAARRGAPLRPRAVVGVTAALGVAVLVGHMLVQWRRGLGLLPDPAGVATTVAGWRRPFALDFLVDEIARPLGLLLAVCALALASRRVPRLVRAAGLLLTAPLAAAVVWWGVRERGGYLLGPACAFAALAALWRDALPARAQNTLVLALLALQGALGWQAVRGFDAEGFALRARVDAVVAATGRGARVLSCNDNAPRIAHWLPQAAEVNLLGTLANDAPLAAWLPPVQDAVRGLLAAGPVALDRSYARRADLTPRVREATQLLEDWLRREFAVTERDDPSWPIWVVARR